MPGPGTAGAPPGSGTSRSPTTTAHSAPLAGSRSRSGPGLSLLPIYEPLGRIGSAGGRRSTHPAEHDLLPDRCLVPALLDLLAQRLELGHELVERRGGRLLLGLVAAEARADQHDRSDQDHRPAGDRRIAGAVAAQTRLPVELSANALLQPPRPG